VTTPRWFKSSYSGNGGECVEVSAHLVANGQVPVRDSKDPSGPALTFSAQGWAAFIGEIKAGRIPS
jgi:hypothetical protein